MLTLLYSSENRNDTGGSSGKSQTRRGKRSEGEKGRMLKDIVDHQESLPSENAWRHSTSGPATVVALAR